MEPNLCALGCRICAHPEAFDLCGSCFEAGHRCLENSHSLDTEQVADGIAGCNRAKYPGQPLTCNACRSQIQGLYLRMTPFAMPRLQVEFLYNDLHC